MGLFLRDTSFRTSDHEGVYRALTEFWDSEGFELVPVPPPVPGSARTDCFTLHRGGDGWTHLGWTAGWEWDLRRRAQLHVSRALDCAGLLTFVYDGESWGYELFESGAVRDQFVHWIEETFFFPGRDTTGRPDVLVDVFPELALDAATVAGYLSPFPEDERDEPSWNVRVRPDDAYTRGDPLCFMDFWRMLGIDVGVRDERITLAAPVARRFGLRRVAQPAGWTSEARR
ncbi:hypothetical protein GCM10009665_77400 [Kitasatospora nipponensis]|uniref:Uncharacterized protein n=1 Tax=Kitasatospora nipponensis TaxID=258049 RepID=A0ABP4DUV3_9ACTN